MRGVEPFYIVGIDEAGRGPLAGPVFAAACWLNESAIAEMPLFSFIRDSKTLSEKKRHQVADFLRSLPSSVCFFGIGSASVVEIDALNIFRATLLAMERAYHAMGVGAALAIVDGIGAPSLPCPIQTVIRGDQIHKNISAASILAKAARDAEMHRLHENFPQYGWEKNKGYGTEAHRRAVHQHGLSPHHRRSFRIRDYVAAYTQPLRGEGRGGKE